MKSQRFIILALVVMFCVSLSVQPAQAVTTSGVVEFTCNELRFPAGFTLTGDRDNTGAGSEFFWLVAIDGKGTELFKFPLLMPVGMSFPLPPISLPYFSAPAYNPITLTTVSEAGNGLPEQITIIASGECEGLPWAAGPTHPADYVQRTILCDVPVYNTPGGSPVGDNALKAGQSWHVNPTPVDGPDGQQWTEVFAGGYQRPFIPTVCVGG